MATRAADTMERTTAGDVRTHSWRTAHARSDGALALHALKLLMALD